MFYAVSAAICLLAVPSNGYFMGGSRFAQKSMTLSSSVQDKTISQIDAPDFYWEYRLERLASKKNGELMYSAKNYPDVRGFKDLYDAYYLDLTLQGKLDGFNWEEEKKISDSEWLTIYKSICEWTSETAKKNKPDASNLPANDFDLLKQFYPQLSFRELESPFAAQEVGANFPYKNMKEMLQAALDGKLSVPGYSKSITSLEATDAKTKLDALKTKTMKKLDDIQADTLAYAKSSFPDDAAKAHYKKLSAKLADFPQGAVGWAQFRAKMEVEVDEMAKLASKKVDAHHHHGEGEEENHEPSPAEEFQAKYGRSLDEMQERMNKYKADPKGFLEASIIEKFGQKGLDVWKKSEEFSSQMSSMSEADKSKAEKAFADFLKSA